MVTARKGGHPGAPGLYPSRTPAGWGGKPEATRSEPHNAARAPPGGDEGGGAVTYGGKGRGVWQRTAKGEDRSVKRI